MKGGTKVVVEPHRHEGVFVARGKEDALVTLNSTPGVAVYGEKRISVETPSTEPGGAAVKTEYRVWNPFRSKSKWNKSWMKNRNSCKKEFLLYLPFAHAFVSTLSQTKSQL